MDNRVSTTTATSFAGKGRSIVRPPPVKNRPSQEKALKRMIKVIK